MLRPLAGSRQSGADANPQAAVALDLHPPFSGRAPTPVAETPMATKDPTQKQAAPGDGAAMAKATPTLTREQLAQLLNEDLSREYQAIVAYTIYSQVLKGAAYMKIAEDLVGHAKQELEHALII